MLDEKMKANQPIIRKVLEPLSDDTMSLYSNRSVATKTDDVESAKLIGHHSSKSSTSKTLVTNKKLQAKQVKWKNSASSRAFIIIFSYNPHDLEYVKFKNCQKKLIYDDVKFSNTNSLLIKL